MNVASGPGVILVSSIFALLPASLLRILRPRDIFEGFDIVHASDVLVLHVDVALSSVAEPGEGLFFLVEDPAEVVDLLSHQILSDAEPVVDSERLLCRI